MDTKEEYLDYEFYVVMAGELPPEYVQEARQKHREKMVNDPDRALTGPKEIDFKPADRLHRLNGDVVVDGRVTFYNPVKLENNEAFKYGDFPFRDHRKDGSWFARPDAEEWHRHPVWKWMNPDGDPHENLTLKPSIGRRGDSGDIVFHCHIRNGEIDWV